MSRIHKIINSDKPIPILAGLASGLYPILFYYSNNFSLINSWEHFYFFVLVFLVLPMVGFYLANKVSGFAMFNKWRKYIIPFLNLAWFLLLMKVCFYAGIQKKIILAILFASVVYSLFFYKHYKKVVLIQLILAVIGIYTVTNTLISQFNFSEEWKVPVDDIEMAPFLNKPNIYFIQPDGYVNFSELEKGYYDYDTSPMREYLSSKGFTNYDGFRSNYASTLSSNSSVMMMKHHYYNKGHSFNEGIDARESIITDNTVLRTMRNNGYKSYFISESPYLMMNRPKVGFDYACYNYDEIDYITSGFDLKRDVTEELQKTFADDDKEPRFYFIEFFNPGHIHGRPEDSEGREGERKLWLESLERANDRLKILTESILNHDPEALIMILGDHGGFVGMDYTHQIYNKTQDRDIIYSIFSCQLSIRWPEQLKPVDGIDFRTSVNVFRVLFAHLNGQTKFLENEQPDESYVIINRDAPKGIYKYIDQQGKIVFEKY